MQDKRMSLQEAVNRFVKDGCSITLGSVAAREPLGVAYEVVRQKKKNLTFITDSSAEPGEIMIAGGCISKTESAYIWVNMGAGFNFRRAVEKGIPCYIETEEYSNLGMSARFMASAHGLPYMPTKSMLGSDIITHNPKIKVVDNPYGSGQVALVPAVDLDVAFIHAHRADKAGNTQIWGMLENDDIVARAAKHVVITCEEIIPTREIRKIPNMTAIPSYCVSAVVELPYGCHPLPVAGYYSMDVPFRRKMAAASKTREGIVAFMDEWIFGVKDFSGYLDKLGYDRLAKLKIIENDHYRIPDIVVKEGAL